MGAPSRIAAIRLVCAVGIGTSLAVALVACSGPGADPSGSPQAESVFFEGWIEQAQGTASEEQLAILERAREAGVLDEADVQSALERTFQCFESADITYSQTIDQNMGLPLPAYTFGGGNDAAPDGPWVGVADACINANSFYVEMAYQNQPRAIDIQEAWFAANGRDQVVACLKANNWDFDEDAWWQELLKASTELWKETAGLDEHPTWENPEAVDCWTDAGL